MKRAPSLALGTLFALSAWTAETKIKVEELPPAVQKAMKEQSKGAAILGASKEQENGRTTYEIETKLAGKGRDLTFDESGSLLEVEREMDLDSIPAPAKEAILKNAANETVQKVESVTSGSSTQYEAHIKTNSGKTREVVVNGEGTIQQE
jgi:uncharacterized membrane protein YkoI